MAIWRMAFRSGNAGPTVWPQCLRFGVAAITYPPLTNTNLSKYERAEPKHLWSHLSGSQHASLARLAYEMAGGDIIYVKEGSEIVNRGVILGEPDSRAYQFDDIDTIVGPSGEVWRHQVPVKWSTWFSPITRRVGTSQQFTIQAISSSEIAEIELQQQLAHHTISACHGIRTKALLEDAYYRESPERLNVIIPQHNRLSNAFCQWLSKTTGLSAQQERDRLDVQFMFDPSRRVIAELKTCFGTGTTKALREAIGQMLEYNHYGSRTCADDWLIVLDEAPIESDIQYFQRLRTVYSLPLVLGWQLPNGFRFYPQWP
jgi:DNA-binding transcriptional regulator YbjK